ncbi:MAG: hypothetical protein OXN87_09330 [Chloroflexota bacterium]|nr:hypothetical protein [Chloroflexota bacterium]
MVVMAMMVMAIVIFVIVAGVIVVVVSGMVVVIVMIAAGVFAVNMVYVVVTVMVIMIMLIVVVMIWCGSRGRGRGGTLTHAESASPTILGSRTPLRSRYPMICPHCMLSDRAANRSAISVDSPLRQAAA